MENDRKVSLMETECRSRRIRWAYGACVSAVLAGLWTFPLQAAEALFVSVSKSVWHIQEGPDTVELNPNLPYEFAAEVRWAKPPVAASATVKGPGAPGATRTLTNHPGLLRYAQRFANLSALNLAHPNGTYTLQTQSAADGRKTNVLTLSADVYPPQIRVVNFAAAQVIDPAQDFVLRWEAAGNVNDLLVVRIDRGSETVFETPDAPAIQGALHGASTTVTVPKGTLVEGERYLAEIALWRRASEDRTGYPGVPAWARYGRRTELPLRTGFALTDAVWAGLAKVQRHQQASAAGPLPAAGEAFQFRAFALATAPANLNEVAATLPNSQARALTRAGAAWDWTASFPTQAALDAAYPSGSYGLTLRTAHNGERKIAVALPPGSAFPAPPKILNWNEANSFDSTRPLTLRWAAMEGGRAGDYIHFKLSRNGQVIFQSGEHPQAAGALNGLSTSVTLPAGLVRPGESNEMTLLFMKVVGLDPYSYPKVLALSGVARETTSTLRAAGGGQPPPQLAGMRTQDGSFLFEIQAVEGRLCVVQTSRNLRDWQEAFATNAPAARFTFRLPFSPAPGGNFVRTLLY